MGVAVKLAAKATDTDPATIIASRFFGGYLMGYPHHADAQDETFGSAVRKLLFVAIFGDDAGTVVRRLNELRQLEDRQIILGWGCGAPDGKRFFSALEANVDADGSLESLEQFAQMRMFDPTISMFD